MIAITHQIMRYLQQAFNRLQIIFLFFAWVRIVLYISSTYLQFITKLKPIFKLCNSILKFPLHFENFYKTQLQGYDYLILVSVIEIMGKEIVDPYVQLENLNCLPTQLWCEHQKYHTKNYFNKMSDIRSTIHNELIRTQSMEEIEAPFQRGGLYFFHKKVKPDQIQYSLYVTKDLHDEAHLIFDPNSLSFPEQINSNSHFYIVHGTWISDGGNRLAYGYSSHCKAGSGTEAIKMSIRVRDMNSGADLPDVISNCRADITNLSWLESRTGFFYNAQLKMQNTSLANFGSHYISNRVLFHYIGTDETEDLVLFEMVTESDVLCVNTQITSDGHYLLLKIYHNTNELSASSLYHAVMNDNRIPYSGNKLYYHDLTKFDGKVASTLGPCIKLIDTFAYRFDYISNIEEDFWFRTNYKSKNYRVVRISFPNTTSPSEKSDQLEIKYQLLAAWKNCLEWIPERSDGAYLESADIAAHTVLVLKYFKTAYHEVLLYDLSATLEESSQIPVADLPHPPYGTISGPNCEFYSADIFYHFSDFSDPGSIYRAVIHRDPYSGSIEISFDQVYSSNIPNIDKYEYETNLEFCSSFLTPTECSMTPQSSWPHNTNKSSDTKDKIENRIQYFMFGKRSVLEEIKPNLSKTTQKKKTKPDIEMSKNESRHDGFVHRHRPCILCVSNGGFDIQITPKFCLPLLVFVKLFDAVVIVMMQNSKRRDQFLGLDSSALNISLKSQITTSTTDRLSRLDYNHQLVFDTVSVINDLIENNITTYDNLGLYGGGSAGIVIGNIIELFSKYFSAAVIQDGIFDLFKYHRYNMDESIANVKDSSIFIETICRNGKQKKVDSVKETNLTDNSTDIMDDDSEYASCDGESEKRLAIHSRIVTVGKDMPMTALSGTVMRTSLVSQSYDDLHKTRQLKKSPLLNQNHRPVSNDDSTISLDNRNRPTSSSTLSILKPSPLKSSYSDVLSPFLTTPPWKNSIWYDEYGCVEESEQSLVELITLSPLQNVSTMDISSLNSFPAIMISTGSISILNPTMLQEKSNMVSCIHSFKFLTALQRKIYSAKKFQKVPILLRIDDISRDTDDCIYDENLYSIYILKLLVGIDQYLLPPIAPFLAKLLTRLNTYLNTSDMVVEQAVTKVQKIEQLAQVESMQCVVDTLTFFAVNLRTKN